MRNSCIGFAIASCLAACGGDSSGAPDAGPVQDGSSADGTSSADAATPSPDAEPGSAPTVTSVKPADQAADAEPTIAITASFSTEMAPQTLDASTFVVTRGGIRVAGTVAYDAATRTATFHPATRLALLGRYAVTITRGATDAAGTPLASDRTWSFAVRDGQWSTARLLSTEAEDSDHGSGPSVAMDAAGRANVVMPLAAIQSVRYEPGAGWGSVVTIAATSSANVALASDPVGNMIAVWPQLGTELDLATSRFEPGTGWSTPMLLEHDDGPGHSVDYTSKVAIDASGAAIVVWEQKDDVGAKIWARRFVPGSGWESAVQLGEGHSPFVAIDDAGRAIGAWLQPRGSESTYDVASRHFDPAAGWAATQLIASTGGSASGVRLVADSAGNVTAIWQQSNGNGEDLWTARWSAGAWGTARLLETDAGSLVVGVALAGDSADNVIAAWSQFDGNDYNVWSRRYVAGSGWAAATMIAAHGGQPVLAVDPSGNAIAVWDRVDVSKSFWAARFTPAGGWGTETRIDTDSSGDSFYPGIAVSATGAAVVGWSRSDGTGHSGVPMHMWTTTFE